MIKLFEDYVYFNNSKDTIKDFIDKVIKDKGYDIVFNNNFGYISQGRNGIGRFRVDIDGNKVGIKVNLVKGERNVIELLDIDKTGELSLKRSIRKMLKIFVDYYKYGDIFDKIIRMYDGDYIDMFDNYYKNPKEFAHLFAADDHGLNEKNKKIRW